MNIDVSTEGGKVAAAVREFPDTCPICFYGIDARYRTGYLFGDGRTLEAIFQCPRMACRHLFIAYYHSAGSTSSPKRVLFLSRVEPLRPRPREFSEELKSVSMEFVTIFNQAMRAEELGLQEISGPGYRKALEFLIKDYAISEHDQDSESIKKKSLASVIKDHISDANIRSTAKRAAWLGNDETHYYRKWEDRDLADMKILIELTIRWIESELLTRHYEEKMAE